MTSTPETLRDRIIRAINSQKQKTTTVLSCLLAVEDELGYIPGRKYLKVVTENSLWGFINIKNTNFKEGDILKGAGYNAPALNKARGNIFNDNYEIAWTGPKYLPGSTGMASYEMQEGTA